MYKNISILGSTGSIGRNTIEVCLENNIKVWGLAANSNIELLEKQARQLKPTAVCIYDQKYYKRLKDNLSDTNITVLTQMEGLIHIATLNEISLVVNAVVGMIGLIPTLSAIEKNKDIALANKETLVTGGKLVMDLAKVKNAKILPVDSEHSAIFQCLQASKTDKIKKIILTASGGPFFSYTKSMLESITKNEALKHPNWVMGSKITIDSATLMNKGLEVIEACWLFNVSPENIEIVVHRESVIHSMVEFLDNSILAQLGCADMKLPIQYALTYPNRLKCNTQALNLTNYSLSFYKPDMDTFICLKACIDAYYKGDFAPTVVNGANEVAVDLFLNDKIKFLDIGNLVKKALDSITFKGELNLDNILRVDKQSREFVLNNI